jgi:hypothetical protein
MPVENTDILISIGVLIYLCINTNTSQSKKNLAFLTFLDMSGHVGHSWNGWVMKFKELKSVPPPINGNTRLTRSNELLNSLHLILHLGRVSDFLVSSPLPQSLPVQLTRCRPVTLCVSFTFITINTVATVMLLYRSHAVTEWWTEIDSLIRRTQPMLFAGFSLVKSFVNILDEVMFYISEVLPT